MTRHSEVIIGAAHRVRIADHLDTMRGAEIQRLEIGECLRLAHLCGDVAIEFRAGGAIQADAALAEFDAITVTRSCELHSRRQVFLMVARFQPRR